MKKDIFEERVKRLQEIDKIIKTLDPAIRAMSFEILKGYVLEIKYSDSGDEENEDTNDSGEDSDNFFAKYNHDKPSDNVLLIAAQHYSIYGTEPLSMDEVKSTADDVGITIPNRPDMTLKSFKRWQKSF